MTTIIVRRTPAGLSIGWDSRFSTPMAKGSLATPKVVAREGFVYGLAGTVRLQNVMESRELPVFEGGDARAWVMGELVPEVKSALDESGAVAVEGMYDFEMLVVVGGRVFYVFGDLGVVEEDSEFWVIGSGEFYAKGALAMGATTIEALRVAARFDPGTGGDLTVKRVEDLSREVAG